MFGLNELKRCGQFKFLKKIKLEFGEKVENIVVSGNSRYMFCVFVSGKICVYDILKFEMVKENGMDALVCDNWFLACLEEGYQGPNGGSLYGLMENGDSGFFVSNCKGEIKKFRFLRGLGFVQEKGFSIKGVLGEERMTVFL